MKVINLYGHLVIDKIFLDTQYYESLGGIANVWDSLLRLDNEILVNIHPTALGDALIIINTKSKEKIAKAILNRQLIDTKVIDADWNHIAYINKIPNIDFIYKLSGIISADVTKESIENCLPYLHLIDYLFISKEDLFENIKELAKKTKGWVIAHDPQGSIYSNGKEIYEYILPKTFYLENANILGAGDSFAAAFILETLKSNDIKNIIENSHIKTTILIKTK